MSRGLIAAAIAVVVVGVGAALAFGVLDGGDSETDAGPMSLQRGQTKSPRHRHWQP